MENQHSQQWRIMVRTADGKVLEACRDDDQAAGVARALAEKTAIGHRVIAAWGEPAHEAA